MLGRLRRWLSARTRSGGDAPTDLGGSTDATDATDATDETDADKSELSRFVPSVLDASVRYSHGGSNPEGERALAEIDEEARRLEEQQRN